MRVKLTYTAAVEDVLAEAANLLANLGGKLNHCGELFNGTIENLRSEAFNSAEMNSDLDLLRKQLGELDIRLMEVVQIVDGYEQYEREQRFPPRPIPGESMPGPSSEEESPESAVASAPKVEVDEASDDY